MSRSRTSGIGCAVITVALILCVLINGALGYINDPRNYAAAHGYYLQADCANAIPYYEKLVEPRLLSFGEYQALSSAELDECRAFQAAVDQQAKGDPSGAILAYSDFAHNYADSPLSAEAKNRIESVFLLTDVGQLASPGLCDQIAVFEEGNLIPQKRTLLPDLLVECGKTYEESGQYSDAAGVYEAFLNDYPDHMLASAVEDSLARAIVRDARESGAGTIPAPELSGSTSDGSTVVVIQNDSPERLRIVFSGPDTRIEELAACGACNTYSFVGPLYCPELGPIGRYTVPAGRYDVVVESISDSGVTPWTGDWDLASGDEYSSCFFITESFSP